jgi:UDP-3-O-[3-hydroxymyristoyl] N-acetylglucosamine deacetylase
LLKDFKQLWQRTLKNETFVSGVALHSGKKVTMRLLPAAANTGIVVVRTDVSNHPELQLNAASVFETKLATKIGSPDCYVSTVEHFMAAAYALGVDNLRIEIDNSEFPILDGSSVPFLIALSSAEIVNLDVLKKVLVVKKLLEVVDAKDPTRFIRVVPSKSPRLTYSIDFSNASHHIGVQHLSMALTGQAFLQSLSFARTFCMQEDVLRMQSLGLALGGDLTNAIVVNKSTGVVNARGLRAEKEFVRHKMLDCIGDLALAGVAVLGEVIAHKAGHDLHTALAKKLEVLAAEQFSSKSSPGFSGLFGSPDFGNLFQFPMNFEPTLLNSSALVSG